MPGCHHHPSPDFDGASPGYRRVLWLVIAINAGMFVVELTAGMTAGSQALMADALDFLGDSATYTITLLVIGRSLAWRARAALFKGASLALMGVFVLASTAWQAMTDSLPHAATMGVVGFAALAANLACVALLLRFREGDANVRSVWLCSRNDAIGNVAVMLAATGVWSSGSALPDLVVAGIMASLFLWSAVAILRQAREELRRAHSEREDAVVTVATGNEQTAQSKQT